MAQYNLVGYNAAPTNPEYDITSQGLSQIPRTNWAEYSLKKEEMRENKKLNRIKTAVDTAGKIASIAATGVDMYQTIDQMDLKKESLKLDNNLKSLDIQSKTIDVSNKADQAAKDLAYTNKIRELQTAQDWAGLGALVLSDIETAQRNSGVTKSIIEQLKFNKFNQADQLFATIFPDEQYKRDQDTLNRQQAITLKSMEINSPYHQALARKANAEAEIYENQLNGAFGGKSIAEMKKANAEYNKLLTNAEAAIGSNGALSQAFETHNIDFVAENKDPNSSFHMYARDMDELKKQYDLLMQLKLSKESLEGKDFSLLQDLFGSDFENTLTNMSVDIENMADKKQWLTFTKNGETFNVLTDRDTAKTLTKAYNGSVERSGYIVMGKTDSLKGDLSQMGYRDFLALSKLPPTTLQGVVEKYPHILESATAQQQNWNSFDKLVKAVTNATNKPAYSPIQNGVTNTEIEEINNTQNPKDFLLQGARQPEEDISKRSSQVVAGLTDNDKEYFARLGMTNANVKDIDYKDLSPEEQNMYAQQGYEFAEDTVRKDIAAKDVKSLAKEQESMDRKLQSILNNQLHTHTQSDDFADGVSKYNKTTLANVKQTNAKNKPLIENIENNFYDKEITILTNQLGELLDNHPEIGSVPVAMGSGGIDSIQRVNSSKAVNNWVSHNYTLINREDIEAPKRTGLGKAAGGVYTRKNLARDLSNTIDNVIEKIKKER